MPVDVEAGSGESETGSIPALLGLQANVVNIKMRGRMYFRFFMARIVLKYQLNSSPRPEGGRSG
jgi:hypothetical protein